MNVQHRSSAPSARFAPDGLFDTVTRFDALWAGWERVLANGGVGGGDGVSLGHFAAVARNAVSQLSHQLRNGRYAPGPVRRVYLPKPDGGHRPLDIPCIRDRVAQSAVAQALVPILEPEFDDGSYGYRPGRSVAQAVARVAALRRDGFRHVVDGDIRRYFESVPHPALIDRLAAHVDDPALVDLIGLWLEHHSHQGLGLPQGSPVSPILANLYLDAVDDAIAGRGLRLVRYADDFVVLCKSEALAKGALARIAQALGEHGLELHPDKTRIVDFNQGFRFLGHMFARGMVWQEAVRLDSTPDEAAIAAAEAATETWERQADSPLPLPEPAPPPPGRWAPRQRVLYVLEPGRQLGARGESFVVREAGGVVDLIAIPHQRLDRIELAVGATLDVEALDLAAASDVTVLRVDGHGQMTGRWSGRPAARAARQLAQAALCLDPARRLAQARLFVSGRIRNQRVQLKRMGRTRPEGLMAVATQKMDSIVRRVERKPDLSLDQVMGYEGEAAALYWPALSDALGRPEVFNGRRRRRKGEDPLNLVLDVLSGLLARDLLLAVERAGLHPGFGVLHTSGEGEDALVFDLIEAFRAPVVEACACAMIGRGALSLEDFAQAGGQWRLSREGWAIVIRQHEAWLSRPIQSPHSGQKVLWRGLFEEEALAFARACESGQPFVPYRMDW